MSYAFDPGEALVYDTVCIYETDANGHERKAASVRQPKQIWTADGNFDTDAMAAALNRRAQIVTDALNAAELAVTK